MPSQSVRAEPEYHVNWHLNQLCNFRCEYCFFAHKGTHRLKEHPECGKYSPEFIAKCFDKSGKIWRIHMSGGEPFLYPKFIELAKALTKHHYLSINSNLSTYNVFKFADSITPERVHAINTSLHILEREKQKSGIAVYIKKLLYLQDKGFTVRLMVISYPPLISRLSKDMEYFRLQGIRNVFVKVFRGNYNGKSYPETYSEEEKELLSHYPLAKHELDILRGNVNFFKRLCMAGQKAFNMDIEGNLTRCSAVNAAYGNLFAGDYSWDECAHPCPVKTCVCPYQGMKFAKTEHGAKFSIAKELLGLYYRTAKQKIGMVILKRLWENPL